MQGLSTHDVGSLVTTMGMLERGCSLRSKVSEGKEGGEREREKGEMEVITG